MHANNTAVIVGKIPHCDFCKEDFMNKPATIDGKTTFGSWANMCFVLQFHGETFVDWATFSEPSTGGYWVQRSCRASSKEEETRLLGRIDSQSYRCRPAVWCCCCSKGAPNGMQPVWRGTTACPFSFQIPLGTVKTWLFYYQKHKQYFKPNEAKLGRPAFLTQDQQQEVAQSLEKLGARPNAFPIRSRGAAAIARGVVCRTTPQVWTKTLKPCAIYVSFRFC